MRCRECGAPVRFVRMRTGKRMPIDVAVTPGVPATIAAMRDSRGELIDGYVITKAFPRVTGYLALVSHFAVCPERRKADGQPARRKTPPPTLFEWPPQPKQPPIPTPTGQDPTR